MNSMLSWELISDFFEGQWVELFDYEWDWNKAHPSQAQVRHHAEDRDYLLQQIQASPTLSDSVIVFVGYPTSFVSQNPEAARV